MKIQLATQKDLNKIMIMYHECVQGMLNLGIDQWNEEYPNRDIIKKDIDDQCYYIGILNSEVVAGIRIDNLQDPTYLEIKWNDESNKFMVVHRLGTSRKVWGQGIGKLMMEFAHKFAQSKECKSMRLDTYSNNSKAIDFYQKLGYQKLGSINLKPEKDIYFCFEKVF